MLRRVVQRASVMAELLMAPDQPPAPAPRPKPVHPHERTRRPSLTTMTTDDLRLRLQRLGWTLRELPVRTGGLDSAEILSYKLIAVKGDKSITLGGKTLHEAMSNMCRTLGALPR